MAKFQKGKSGNPGGRRKGIADKRVQYRALLDPHMRELVEKLIAMAKEGDFRAIKLIADKCIPEARGLDSPVRVMNWQATDTIIDQSRALISAVATGVLTPDQGRTLMSMLASHMDIEKIDDLSKQIAELREHLENQRGSRGH